MKKTVKGTTAFKALAKEYGFEYAEADPLRSRNPIMVIAKVGAPEAAEAITRAFRNKTRIEKDFELDRSAMAWLNVRDDFVAKGKRIFADGLMTMPSSLRKAIDRFLKKGGKVECTADKKQVLFRNTIPSKISKLIPRSWTLWRKGKDVICTKNLDAPKIKAKYVTSLSRSIY